MQVLYPNDLHARKQQRMRNQRARRRKQLGMRFSTVVVCMVLLASGVGVFSLSRPTQAVQPSLVALQTQPVAPLNLPWPTDGQAAVGAVGYGVVDQRNSDKPVPTASTAKIFTALLIMKAKPLQLNQQGPLITITSEDEEIYQKYVAEQGSVYPVSAGQQISQYEALRALLLPSANNIADMLAAWAYGSREAFLTEANQELKRLGMTGTVLDDASGFSPKTVSTARDLTLAGELLMQDPVLASIVATQNFDIPGVGTVHNTNVLLGSNDVVGIKTGHTDEAGGCFVIAIKSKLDATHEITLVSAVLGAADVGSAMKSALRLGSDAKLGFGVQTLVAKNHVVAEYHPAWSAVVSAVATDDLKGVVWLPDPPTPTVSMGSVNAGHSANLNAGSVSASFGSLTASVPVSLQTNLPSPSFSWRLFRRYM